MIDISRVLCPVDFSQPSRHALDHAAAVAGWYGARLTVLYVSTAPPLTGVPMEALEEAEYERLTEQLRCFTTHLPASLTVDRRVHVAAHVHDEVVRQAEALQADLLVMGSHGRSGYRRLLLGSVTEHVVREAPCPTLVVPNLAPDRLPAGPVAFRRILCATDFSSDSARAVGYAFGLAEEGDAHLTLLNVVEMPPERLGNPVSDAVDLDRIHAACRAESLQRLRAMIPPEAKAYCTVETSVREGAAYREILRAAESGNADLIVMGVHGRGIVDLIVFGSNTARVSQHAECPVLIVR